MEDSQDTINKIAAAAAVAAAAAAVTSNAAIMKELSAIQVAQGKNDTEIKNIGESVKEIKSDVKDIKALYVTHDELKVFQNSVNNIDTDHETRIRTSENFYRYGLGALYLLNIVIGWYLLVHFGKGG
jgi:hypothetical protein